MTGSDIGRALGSLRPGAQWALQGDNLAGLTWMDPSTPPTEAEIGAEVARLAALDSSWATDPDRLDIVSKLKGASPTQIKNYVQNTVIDLASARTLLGKVLLVLSKVIQ